MSSLGRSLRGNAPKALEVRRDVSPAVEVVPAKVAPVPLPSPAVVASTAAKAPSPKTLGKPWFEGVWENIFKRTEHKHAPVKLEKLEPQIFKKDKFETEETKEEVMQPMSLEELSTKTDIQAVPAKIEPWEGGSAVDINGDGIPDVRYRQRSS